MRHSVKWNINPFTPKGCPFEESNCVALDRVKSIKSLLGVKGLTENFKETYITHIEKGNLYR